MPESPEVALWRAVIAQAMLDATNWRSIDVDAPDITAKTRTGRIASAREMLRLRDEARSWLLGDSADFRKVCDMSLLEPDAVRQAAEDLAVNGWPYRATKTALAA